MIKIKFLFLFFIVILFFQFIKADTTFFDSEEDIFILGNPLSSEITGIIKDNKLNGDGSCLTNWICSDWNSCINGVQTRNCAKEKSYCYADLNEKPDESQDCFVEEQNKTQEPRAEEKENKEIKIFIFTIIIILATISLFLFKRHRKIRHKKYGY